MAKKINYLEKNSMFGEQITIFEKSKISAAQFMKFYLN